MFPFHVPNTYINAPLSYNLNYDFHGLHQIQGNPLLYPYNYQNFNLLHENHNANYVTHQQTPYFLPIVQNSLPKSRPVIRKRKRITKKLTLTQVKKPVRLLGTEYKEKRKTFKYLDPSRAPPITSLRTNRELELDLRQDEMKRETESLSNNDALLNRSKSTAKLQLLLKEPNDKDYPFLICKRRKYHRHSKRRYSVAYFQQRALYIINKQPIPPSLHPKNKVRKSRGVKRRVPRSSEYQSNSFDSSSDHYPSQRSSDKSENSDFESCDVKKEKYLKCDQNQIKVEVKMQ